MSNISSDTIPGMHKRFQNTVWKWYEENRRDLPWRPKANAGQRAQNPYRILVSEVMLQQTQVSRVLEKYKEFLQKFPTVEKLAEANLADVLRVWQGLGYNRRGKFLRQAAQEIQTRFGGKFPKDYDSLVSLPGVGDYTAKAVLTFAHNQRHTFVETNIRTVYFHHFFKNVEVEPLRGSYPQKAHRRGSTSYCGKVHDREVLELVEKTLPGSGRYREWYSALMDYGSYLKSQGLGQNKKSKHYAKQSKFQGSFRQLRARILSLWLEQPRTLPWLYKNIGRQNPNLKTGKEEIKKALRSLRDEGLID